MESYWLHGWAVDRQVFTDLIYNLPAAFKAGARNLDLPGFGTAGPLGRGESYAGRLLNLIGDSRGSAEGLALVGWSLGALVAMEAACTLGNRLQALVLISACRRFSSSAANPHGTDSRLLKAMCRSLRRQPGEVLEEFFRSMFDTHESDRRERFRLEFRPRYCSLSPQPLIEGLRYLERVDLSGRTERITAPVLILHGGRDTVIDPRQARLLERSLPNASLVLFEDAGHMPFLGREEEFAGLIGDFLKSNASG